MRDHDSAMTTSDRIALFAPRVLGLALVGFLALFALDAFTEGQPLAIAIGNGAVHLVPAAIALALVAVAWRWPLVGAVGFLAAAALYAWIAPRGHVDWIAVISGPLAIVSALYFWSWRTSLRAPATPRA